MWENQAMKKMKATEPEGLRRARADDDTEGHSSRLRAIEPEGIRQARASEDDTEGHMIGNPLLGQQLARSREQEIQRNLKARATREEVSRPHKK